MHGSAAPLIEGGGTNGVVPVSGPVVEFVDAAIRAAFAAGASDIHFECGRAGVVVKLRQDGVLTWFARMDDAQTAGADGLNESRTQRQN